jgi:hypothetical protein
MCVCTVRRDKNMPPATRAAIFSSVGVRASQPEAARGPRRPRTPRLMPWARSRLSARRMQAAAPPALAPGSARRRRGAGPDQTGAAHGTAGWPRPPWPVRFLPPPPPGRPAIRSICAVSAGTELSRSPSAAASEIGSCSWARGGELVPDDQRRVVGPLQVLDDHHHGGGRTQLVRQRDQHLDAVHRCVAVAEQSEALAAEQASGMRPPRVRRTQPHLKPVQHYPQRQLLDKRVRQPPSDIPPGLAYCRQGLGHQGRLADARLALDPDHRSLVTAERLHAAAEGRELLARPTHCGGRSMGHMGVKVMRDKSTPARRGLIAVGRRSGAGCWWCAGRTG